MSQLKKLREPMTSPTFALNLIAPERFYLPSLKENNCMVVER